MKLPTENSSLWIHEFWFIFVPLLIGLLFPQSVSANSYPTLLFNITTQAPLNTQSQDGFLDELTREALRRIGYQLATDRLPAARLA